MLSEIRAYLVLSFCLLLPLLTACATGHLRNLEEPRVTLVDVVSAEAPGVFEQRYNVTLRIQNPNNVDLPLEGLNYTVFLNDREFARGVSRDHAVVPALGEEVVHVTVTNSPLDWVKQIDRLQSDPALQPSYKVQGALFLQGYGQQRLPFSQSGQFLPSH